MSTGAGSPTPVGVTGGLDLDLGLGSEGSEVGGLSDRERDRGRGGVRGRDRGENQNLSESDRGALAERGIRSHRRG